MHVAAVAAKVSVLGGAVDKVLRAEVHQLPRGLGHQALQGPDSAEGPARAAGALLEKQKGRSFLN